PFRALLDRRGHLFEAPPRAPRQDETHAFSTTFWRFQMPQEQFVGPTFFRLRVGFINEAQGVLWSGFEDVQRGAEPAFVGFGQVQQDGVGQVFFTHSLTSESAGLWDARSETILDFRLSCNLARCFIRYLRRCQRSPLLEAAHSIRVPSVHDSSFLQLLGRSSGPGGIRTLDSRIRNPVPYP